MPFTPQVAGLPCVVLCIVQRVWVWKDFYSYTFSGSNYFVSVSGYRHVLLLVRAAIAGRLKFQPHVACHCQPTATHQIAWATKQAACYTTESIMSLATGTAQAI